MKTQLIKTQDRFILVNDEGIKEGDWFCFPLYNGGYCIKQYNSEQHFNEEPCISLANLKAKKIIAGTPSLPEIDLRKVVYRKILNSLLSEEDCKRIGWVNVDKNKGICKCKRAYQNPLSEICVLCWNEIYPNEKDEVKEEDLIIAQSLNDKMFSLGQVRNLVNSVTEFMSHNEPEEFDGWFEKKIQLLQSLNDKMFSLKDIENAYNSGKGYGVPDVIKDFRSFIQSLQQTSWDVEVEMEQYTQNYHKDIWYNKPKITNNSIKITKIL